MKINLYYNLKGMRKSGLTREERKELEINAKQARDLEIGYVEAPWYIQAKWSLQDFSEKIGMNKLPSKLKGIGTRIAGLLPAGKGAEKETIEHENNEEEKENEGKKVDRFGHSTEKTQQEIEADEIAKNIGREVETIQNENSGR